MKNEMNGTGRLRTAAGICAVLMIAGCTAGMFTSCASVEEDEAPNTEQTTFASASSASAKDTISAGGTVSSSKLEEDLGIKNTSVRLTIEETLVESGDTVTEGTALYKITQDSLDKAEKTLRSELDSAENALLEKKTSYQVEKTKAQALYESEQMLGNTAEYDYNSSIKSLNASLQEAYEAYSEALGTINNNPSEISTKQSEVDSLQEDIEKLQKEEESLRTELEDAKKAYDTASESYDKAYSEYKTAAGVVSYLETALGIDPSESKVSDLNDKNEAGNKGSSGKTPVKTDDTSKTTPDTKTAPDSKTGAAEDPSKAFPEDGKMPDISGLNLDDIPETGKTASLTERKSSAEAPESGSADDSEALPKEENATSGKEPTYSTADKDDKTDKTEHTMPEGTIPGSGGTMPDGNYPTSGFPDLAGKPEGEEGEEEEKITEEMLEEYASGKVSDALNELYESACKEQEQKKTAAEKAEKSYKEAETKYDEANDKLNECSKSVEEAQSSVKDLNKEINTLESDLAKAKNNLSKLRSEYNSLYNSYEKDKLEIKHTYDTDTASSENAEYHYNITCATLEDELSEAQEAWDIAEENLKIFEEVLSEGYISAAQDGVVYSVSWQEGRSADITASYICYVDENSFVTTVELDQNDVTKISIGDSVLLYSSETGITNGRVTAVSEGTAKSLADVRFNVTVTADEGSQLYVGESVNVYFNSGTMDMSGFTDFKGSSESGSEGGRGFGGEGFGGGFPGDFDPSAMPGFGRGKED